MTIWQIIVVGVLLAIYFLPTIVADRRKHRNRTAILVLNLFLGWTFLGWLVALIWACTAPQIIVVTASPPDARSLPRA